jgi:yeast amino acid transporter
MSQSDSIAPAPKVEKDVAAVEKKASKGDLSEQSSHDPEKNGVTREPELKRKLKSRHLQMIAIGMPLIWMLTLLC